MIIKFAVAGAFMVCAGCGIYRHGAETGAPALQPNSAINLIQDTPVDAVLIDQTCSGFEACRTTAHGLGV